MIARKHPGRKDKADELPDLRFGKRLRQKQRAVLQTTQSVNTVKIEKKISEILKDFVVRRISISLLLPQLPASS